MGFYVYELVDSRDESVFYVGKGKGRRAEQHEAAARKGVVSDKCDRIREIWKAGGFVKRTIVYRTSDEIDAYAEEARRIAVIGLHNLTNVQPGGVGGRADGRAEDAKVAAAIAEFFNRTRGGVIKRILVAGRVLDLEPIAESYASRMADFAKKHGADWVDSISAKMGVVFQWPNVDVSPVS